MLRHQRVPAVHSTPGLKFHNVKHCPSGSGCRVNNISGDGLLVIVVPGMLGKAGFPPAAVFVRPVWLPDSVLS